MVRHYKRKTDKASYCKDKLLQAIEAVRKGELSAYRASIVYGVPRPTIVNRLYNRRGLKSNTLGRSTVLSKEVEEHLVKNLHTMERYGFGLTRQEILEVVGEYVTTNNIPNSFKNGIPGEFWFLGFKERHNLSVKKPQAVENSRKKACNPFVVYPYFDMLKDTLDELHLHNKPSHIWNLDETSFSKDPSKTKIVGLKGYAATRTISSPGKDNTTVLLGCNAVGEKTPPLIVYKGKNVWDEWTSKEDYPGTVYAATKNGWMETQIFETFFEKVFLKTVGEKRPILLLYDGHSTHVGINIIEKAREASVTILKIPPHTSDNLQPLDLAVNKSFKDKWDLTLVKWQRLHVGQILPKKEFSKIVGEVWKQVDPGVCAAGFRKAGIVPYNRNAIPAEKFHADKLEEWKKHLELNVAQEQVVEAPGTLTLPTALLNNFEPQARTPFSHSTLAKDLCPIQQAPNIFPIPTLMTISLNIWNSLLKAITDPAVEPDNGIQINDERPNTSSLMPPTTGTYETHQRKKNLTDKIISINDLSIVPLSYDISLKSQQNTWKLSTHMQTKINILDDQPVNLNVSFDDLLLKKIKSGTSTKQKRTKIADGAEVITHEDSYRKRKLTEEENTKKLKIKEEKQAKKLNSKANNLNKSKKKKKMTKGKKIDKYYISSESEMDIHLDDDDTDCDLDYDNYCTNVIAAGEEESDLTNDIDNNNEPSTSTNYNRKKTTVKTKNLPCPKIRDRKKTSNESITSESYTESYLDENNSKCNDNDSEIVLGVDEEQNSQSKYTIDEPATSTITQGQWALVKFATKKDVKHFIGVVTELNDNGTPTMNFVRKSRFGSEDKIVFVFPNVPDICQVKHLEDIVIKLPSPTKGRRGQIMFKMSFAGYNVQ